MERKLSSLIGKQLLSPAGERLGYVLDATLTQTLKGVSCLRCADGEDEELSSLPRDPILRRRTHRRKIPHSRPNGRAFAFDDARLFPHGRA